MPEQTGRRRRHSDIELEQEKSPHPNHEHFVHNIGELVEVTQASKKKAKRLLKLQKDIWRKQNKVGEGGRSKYLQKYQLEYQKDLTELGDLTNRQSKVLSQKPLDSTSKLRHTVPGSQAKKQPASDCSSCTRFLCDNDKLSQEILQLQEQIKGNQKIMSDMLDSHEKEIRRLETEIQHIQQQRDTEKDLKDDALRRLSAMASSKLRDNNPNITDLSDQNRPTKIAEKMSELYDNQWTDAFDALQAEEKEERDIIKELLDMLMNVFRKCSQLAKDQFFEKIQDCIEFPAERRIVRDTKVVLPEQLKQLAKEFRRQRAVTVLKDIEEVVLQNLILKKPNSEVQKYLSVCVEISWLAAVQDPPVALCDTSGDQFDTNVFKDYTQRGPFVDYVVWPAIRLHENGPLLGKGVAQGCQKKTESSKPASESGSQQSKNIWKSEPVPVNTPANNTKAIQSDI